MIIINRIVWILNLLAGVLLLLSYAAPYINPMIWWIAAFFGLAFPLLFVINGLFLIYWLVMGKLKLIFPVACMLMGYSHFGKVYKLSGAEAVKEEGDIQVMSMNVKYFGQGDKKYFLDSLASYIKMTKPDIICFQEYAEYLEYNGPSSSNKIKKAG